MAAAASSPEANLHDLPCIAPNDRSTTRSRSRVLLKTRAAAQVAAVRAEA